MVHKQIMPKVSPMNYSNKTIDTWMEKVVLYLQNYKSTLFNWFINSMTG